MSTGHRAHVGACAVSDVGITLTTRTRQQESGRPEGLRWLARSSSEQLASHARTSDACGLMHCQHGSHKYSSIGISMLLRRELRIKRKNRLRCRFAQRQTRIACAGSFARVVDRDLAGDLGKRLVDVALSRARSHHVSLWNCANNSRSSRAGPSVPSLRRGVIRNSERSTIQPVIIAPGGPLLPSGPAMPR